MKKIGKYCSACNEGFFEKFSFCPNCATELVTYQFKELLDENSKAMENSNDTENLLNAQSKDVLFNDKSKSSFQTSKYNNNDYHIALVEFENNSVRNSLLLGAFMIVTLGTFSGVILSIFTTSLNIGSISDDKVIVSLSMQNPDAIDENQELPSKKDEDAGGGGTGGNKDKNPLSKGREAKMIDDPLIAPSIKNVTLSNPEIKIQPAVKGPQVNYKEDKTQPYGSKNSIYTIPSDGEGENGGQGKGNDRGQGDGNGPGIGVGSDGGKGGGKKGGLGPGIGPGIASKENKNIDDEIPPEVKKVTTALKIISKPKAIYTDGARENAVQGTVTLRVTFLANGSVGNITTVSGLPFGLTEKAIEAARNIKFEPQKINGIAQSVNRQIQYTFTLF